MKIGLILHPFGEKESSGIGRMSLAVSRALIENSPEHQFLVFTKSKKINDKIFHGNNWEAYAVAGGVFWLDRLILRYPKADAYIFFTPVTPIFFRPKKSIVFALDFAVFYKSSRTSLIKKATLYLLYQFSFFSAKHIIAISQYTRRELQKIFFGSGKKISVIYNGVNNVCEYSPKMVEGVAQTFFLFVGVVKERKNVDNIIRGFEKFVSISRFNGQLVIAGKSGGEYGAIIDRTIQDCSLQGKVRVTGFISDEELSYLYKNAIALVSPTRVEGFGMTTIEAMACGIPIISSNTEVSKEVVGDAGILVDPENPDEIANAMNIIYTDKDTRNNLIKRGKERSALFTWTKTANELKKLLTELS